MQSVTDIVSGVLAVATGIVGVLLLIYLSLQSDGTARKVVLALVSAITYPPIFGGVLLFFPDGRGTMAWKLANYGGILIRFLVMMYAARYFGGRVWKPLSRRMFGGD